MERSVASPGFLDNHWTVRLQGRNPKRTRVALNIWHWKETAERLLWKGTRTGGRLSKPKLPSKQTPVRYISTAKYVLVVAYIKTKGFLARERHI